MRGCVWVTLLVLVTVSVSCESDSGSEQFGLEPRFDYAPVRVRTWEGCDTTAEPYRDTTFQYDVNGLLTTRTESLGRSEPEVREYTYTYDKAARLVEVVRVTTIDGAYFETERDVYTYVDTGRPDTATHSEQQVDDTEPHGRTSYYEYDESGRLARVERDTDDGTTTALTLSYAGGSRRPTLAVDGDDEYAVSYDDGGRVEQMSWTDEGNLALVSGYVYDEAGWISGICHGDDPSATCGAEDANVAFTYELAADGTPTAAEARALDDDGSCWQVARYEWGSQGSSATFEALYAVWPVPYWDPLRDFYLRTFMVNP